MDKENFFLLVFLLVFSSPGMECMSHVIPHHGISPKIFSPFFLKIIKLHKKPPIKQSFTPLFAQMLSVIMSALKVRKQRFSYGDL